MGCGASQKKAKPAEGAKSSEEKKDDQGIVAETRDVALDAVGFIATAVGGAASMVGHGLATGALTVADCATLGMIDSLGDARDEEYKEMVDGRDDAAMAFKCHTETDFYRGDPCCDMSDWMSKVPCATLLNEMWIPGTHDTMADNGGDLAECQKWSVQQQLQSGIRVLDLRAKHDADALPCFHGIIPLHHDFKDAVSDLEQFVTEHPKEAVFVRIKQEGDSGKHSCHFHDLVVKQFGKAELWNFKAISFSDLGKFRGKITILAFGSNLKLYLQKLAIQDEYKTSDEDKKFEIIKAHSNKERVSGVLSINFCSAVGLEGWTCFKPPSAVAYAVNKMLLESKDTLGPGAYLCDFPGNGLLKALVTRNKTSP